ncbi:MULTISPECIES: class I SAM-dependent methyltransferase [unclassified Streptomyces]|uniref:class I SAM-dependent methyltransferase n=1 Tax=unclassified Streptomyces TaxID=2593676 RepID=UPI001BE5D812|nr:MULTISPECIES: class I SAM-dependent methyltransferase [unclassified Streptomyces]MBT2405105.1 class I SAM-dependent methyltransferase [Streptomyces sp. ISL-21]MBT2610873.1 class I SAM-dependent methyltransferase [Streptomyces sp. ISL-87]
MSETSYLNAVRASYDAVAVDYARLLSAELGRKPLDRAMLAAFAEYVRGQGGGDTDGGGSRAVADLGCGPGRVTAYLDALGVRAFGVDLSPAMVAVARRTYPGLRFEVGSMAALDVADGVLGGVLAWYSTVHTPPGELPPVFAEFARVLAPGGYVLIAFKAGDERFRLEHAYGHPVDLEVYWTPPDRIAALLADAGLAEVARLVREPDAHERSPQGFLLARKSPGSAGTPGTPGTPGAPGSNGSPGV